MEECYFGGYVINFTKITKINTPPWVFFHVNCTNGAKSRKASLIMGFATRSAIICVNFWKIH